MCNGLRLDLRFHNKPHRPANSNLQAPIPALKSLGDVIWRDDECKCSRRKLVLSVGGPGDNQGSHHM